MLDKLELLYDPKDPSHKFFGFEAKNVIDAGSNSIVINAGEGNVIKVYEEGKKHGNELSFEQLSFYQKITNKLSLRDNLVVNGIPVRFVPIKEIGFSKKLGCHYSVSELVEGPNLDAVFNHGTGIINIQKELEALGFDPTNLQDNLIEMFGELNKALIKELHLNGISISLMNVKYSPTKREFIVTDTCPDIRNLQLTTNPQ